MNSLLWKKRVEISIVVMLVGIVVALVFDRLYSRSNFATSNDRKMEVSVSATPKITPLLIKGSIPYWDQKNGFSSFQANAKFFDFINLFWYYMGKDGSVLSYKYAFEDRAIINFAHENKVKVFAVITNLPEYEGATWDSERVEYVLEDNTRRAKHISYIVDKVEALNFDGVTIDYESVDSSVKQYFTTFIQELSEEIHKKGKLVAVSLHPKTGDRKKGEELGLFQDWKELSRYADQLTIMAYNEHWDESRPGPIASVPWIQKIVAYTKTLQLPEEKIFLGIPLYGYDWEEDGSDEAKGLTYQDVEDVINAFDPYVQWDSQAKSPYFQYEKNSIAHEVWFENAESVREKIRLAQEANFGGITFWRLGGEDSNVWDAVKDLK